MKNILSILMMSIVISSTFAMNASATNTNIDFVQLGTTNIGETFELQLNLSENQGFNAFEFTLGFNPEVVDCISIENGELMQGVLSASNPDAYDGARLVGATINTIYGEGNIATFNFKVLNEGDFEFVLSKSVVSDINGDEISYVVNGIPQSNEPIETNPPIDETLNDESYNSESTTVYEETTKTESYSSNFSDINGHFAEEYIEKAYELGLVEGYGNGKYGPDDNLTRAQLVTILWRNEGSPAPLEKASFTDLDLNETYYNDAIAWAEDENIVLGYGNGIFGPDDLITREQLATIISRLDDDKNQAYKAFSSIYDDAFHDSSDVMLDLKDSVYWAIYNEIWCDTDSVSIGDELNAKDFATRGQVAIMLVSYNQYLEEGGR